MIITKVSSKIISIVVHSFTNVTIKYSPNKIGYIVDLQPESLPLTVVKRTLVKAVLITSTAFHCHAQVNVCAKMRKR